MIYAICDFLEMDGEEDSQEMTVWKKINIGALIPNIHRDLHKVRDDMQKQDSQVKLEEKKNTTTVHFINQTYFIIFKNQICLLHNLSSL